MCTRANFGQFSTYEIENLQECFYWQGQYTDKVSCKSDARSARGARAKCARGQILANFRFMRLKICRSVFIGKDNILSKFRANPMHVVHVVHVQECALLEPNITGFSRDFKRARYQKLAFVEYI